MVSFGLLLRRLLVRLNLRLDLVPEVLGDDGLVEPGIDLAGVGDLSQVGPVLQYGVERASREPGAAFGLSVFAYARHFAAQGGF